MSRDKLIIENWPEGTTEEQKDYARAFLKHIADEQTRLCVIYNPDCGCSIDQMVVLDRYPMSPKIISRCPECKKGCLMEISDPIRFHLPLTDQDFSLEDLKDFIVDETCDQAYLIKRYQNLNG